MTTAPKNLPVPTLSRADWAAAVSEMTEPFSLRHIRDMDAKKFRLHLIEAGRQITFGLKERIIEAHLLSDSGERVNHYIVTDQARTYWQNGREQGLSNEKILDGWRAMQSILEDIEEGKAAAAGEGA